MADNTTFQTTLASPPSGLVVATDDVGGVHYQRVKLDVGAENASALLSNANPLPVSDAGGSITVDGTVTATLSASIVGGSPAVSADFDSGGGTQNNTMLGIALPASGGAVIGGTFTNPLRVDPTGTTTQPVSDAGGSLTVDGSVSIGSALPAGNNNIGDVDIASIAAGDNVVGRVKLTDGTTVVDVFDYTNSNPMAVRLTDTNGDYVAAGAGTQYTEDAAAPGNPVGGALALVRDDARGGSLTTTDGDIVAARGTNAGELYVKHVDSVPVTDNGGSLTVDGAVTVSGTVAVSSLPALVAGTANIGDVDVLTVPAPLSTTGNGTASTALRVTVASDSTGVIAVTDNGGSLTVDGTVAVSSLPALVAGTANIGDVDVLTLPSIPAGSNNIGDVDIVTVPAPLSTTGNGAATTALRVTLANDSTGIVALTGSLPAGTNNIGDVDVLTLPNVTLAAGTNTNEVVGDAAHGASVAGNPLLNGFEARTSDATAVTNGQVVRGSATTLGKQIAYPYAVPGLEWRYAAASGGITNTTGVTAKSAGGAGVRNYITSVQVVNGHASTSTEVEIRDGAAGTVMWRGFAQAQGGGVSAKFDPPLRGSANTLVEIANVTTSSATYFNLQGFTSGE